MRTLRQKHGSQWSCSRKGIPSIAQHGNKFATLVGLNLARSISALEFVWRRYRLNVEKFDWNIYVTDVGQWQHFDMLFKAVRRAGWLPKDPNDYPICTHIGFGLVCSDGRKRFRSRSSETVRLVDLLDEAKRNCKVALLERDNAKDWTEDEIEKTSEAIGYGAVKYADLKINRTTNYTFSFDQMLNDKTGNLVLEHEDERTLGLHLLQFTEVFVESCSNLLLNVLCEYLYNLSEIFTKKFYSSRQVVGSPEETSRLLLCEATLIVMRHCFYLLGIDPVYKL